MDSGVEVKLENDRVLRPENVSRLKRGLRKIEEQSEYVSTKMEESADRLYPHAWTVGIYQLLIYSMFLSAVIVTAWFHTTSRSPYFMTLGAVDKITNEELPFDVENFATGMFDINKRENIYPWITGPMADALIPENGSAPLRYVVHSNTMSQSMVLAGRVRMRQLRVRKDTCYKRYKAIKDDTCIGAFSDRNQEKGLFLGISWQSKTNGMDFVSRTTRRSYPSSGYVINLKAPSDELTTQMADLEKRNWIDPQTRALFIEAVVYVIARDRFVAITALFETMESGTVAPSLRFESLRPENPGWIIVMELIVYLSLFAFLWRHAMLIRKIHTQDTGTPTWWTTCKKYIVADWIWITWFICITLCISFVLRCILWNKLGSLHAKDALMENSEDNFNFFEAANISTVYGYYMSFLTMLAVIRSLQYVSKVPTHGPVALAVVKTMSNPQTLVAIIVISIFFLGYAMMLHFALGPTVNDFRTFGDAFVGLTRLALGDWSYEDFYFVHHVYGPFFFLLSALITAIVLLNILIGVLGVVYGDELLASLAAWSQDSVDTYIDYYRDGWEPWSVRFFYFVTRLRRNRYSPKHLGRPLSRYGALKGYYFNEHQDDEEDDKGAVSLPATSPTGYTPQTPNPTPNSLPKPPGYMGNTHQHQTDSKKDNNPSSSVF
eukprot:NODE_159_length_2334_cov_123.230635_g118_i1.p1 GENE.NODE_159_length_2334_cov_123.230635_g118_i1~~NODE_159_length_2334_cov_123.230635_g118_i1.p1  ORF type:complete len:759 (-),score=204.59 NODE_159_length_2334_cov_123.230635_g118_i1:57-2042(-)